MYCKHVASLGDAQQGPEDGAATEGSRSWLSWRCPIRRQSGLLEKALWEGMERDPGRGHLPVHVDSFSLLSKRDGPSLLLVNSWSEEQLATLHPLGRNCAHLVNLGRYSPLLRQPPKTQLLIACLTLLMCAGCFCS